MLCGREREYTDTAVQDTLAGSGAEALVSFIVFLVVCDLVEFPQILIDEIELD